MSCPERGTEEYSFHRDSCDTCYGIEMDEMYEKWHAELEAAIAAGDQELVDELYELGR